MLGPFHQGGPMAPVSSQPRRSRSGIGSHALIFRSPRDFNGASKTNTHPATAYPLYEKHHRLLATGGDFAPLLQIQRGRSRVAFRMGVPFAEIVHCLAAVAPLGQGDPRMRLVMSPESEAAPRVARTRRSCPDDVQMYVAPIAKQNPTGFSGMRLRLARRPKLRQDGVLDQQGGSVRVKRVTVDHDRKPSILLDGRHLGSCP